MSKTTTKNRKRRKGGATQLGGFSKSLWDARNLIVTGNNDKGLATLNQLAASTQNPKRRAKILVLVGESQARLSRHADAAAAFGRASEYARQAADLALLLDSSVGQIRSLLRSLRADEAKTAAASLFSELDKAQQDYQKILNLTPAQLAANGTVQVSAQPPRPTVILTKIANAFIESGLTDDARAFLLKAISLAPNGAARARQALAKLALASDDPALAERYARESLLMGRFQAKTVAAWQLYLDARARQNLSPILEPDVFTSFQANAKGRIATASIHSIARVLRAHGDSAWKGIAQATIISSQADKIISTELEKLIQADAKLTGSEEPRLIAARSLRLFRASGTTAQEQVSHAKTYARYALVAGRLAAFDSVVTLATTRFGVSHANSVIHTMALGAMQKGDHDIARKWLTKLLTSLDTGSESWGRAVWALARMEALLKRHSEAAILYFQIASANQIPSRFRMQSMLLGFKNLAASGDNVNLDEIAASMRSLLAGVTDYRIAMDAARQLSLAGSPLLGLRNEAAAKGMLLADQALVNSTRAADQLAILEYIARKQFWDLHGYQSVVQRWSRLAQPQKAEMQATGGSVWYEYCALVMQSMVVLGMNEQARDLASSILDKGRATPEGYVIMGNAYATWLLKIGKTEEAFTYFDWIAVEAPTHVGTAAAHYWLGLRFLNMGNKTSALSCAKAVRQCFAGKPSLLSEWELDAKGLLILKNLSADEAAKEGSAIFTTEFIHQMLARLKLDRELIL